MKNEDIKHFEEKLQEEQEKLEKELKTVGKINPDNPKDWMAKPSDMNTRAVDPNKRADYIEEFETNTAILKQLETQLIDVKSALIKITDGTYGICEVSGEQISNERLEANPSAKTCREHM